MVGLWENYLKVNGRDKDKQFRGRVEIEKVDDAKKQKKTRRDGEGVLLFVVCTILLTLKNIQGWVDYESAPLPHKAHETEEQ